jgi:hypothetical protein
MTTALQFRNDQNTTIASLEADINEGQGDYSEGDYPLSDISFHLTSDTPTIQVGSNEIPATKESVIRFAESLQIPKPFMTRVGKEMGLETQQTILDAVLARSKGSGFGIRYNDARVISVYEPGKAPLDPLRLTRIARNVLGEDAVVQRLVNEPSEFAFDVHVPFTGNSGVHGDASSLVEVPSAFKSYSWATGVGIDEHSRVADLTAAGLRFGANLQQGLAPYVQPWNMRLACTNGMESTDTGLKVDARGSTLDEVLAELEGMAERAFSRQEAQIEHFYRLREQRVTDPTQTINRLARERGISDRIRLALIDLVPTLPSEASMFDVVNMMTNFANSPAMAGGARMGLEAAGGRIVADDQARCNSCHQHL